MPSKTMLVPCHSKENVTTVLMLGSVKITVRLITDKMFSWLLIST